LFAVIQKVQRAARKRIGTGVLNRLLRHTFEANPPPLVKGRRLKLFYATQPKNGGLLGQGSLGEGGQSAEELPERADSDKARRNLAPPEFVMFVNDPQLMTEAYRRYLEARIRDAEPYAGMPIILTLRARAKDGRRR
jgi:GTP-binding protein